MNENVLVATRQIAWNIPTLFIVIMYASFILAVAVFFKGLYGKYLFISQKKSIKQLIPEKLNWKAFCRTFSLQGKVPRVKFIGFFHGAIYYGFMILVVATTLVMLQMDLKLEVFTGLTYIVVSFLADIAGVAISLAVLIAFYRRYISKPDFLNASKPKQELFMYILILAIIKTGFWLEGIRILETGMPVNEKLWSPVGYFCAWIFQMINFSDSVWMMLHKVSWIIHMVLTMVFIGSMAYSKFIHIIFAPLNGLITQKGEGAILEPMNFEDENAETFGLGKFSETTMKNRLDLLSCVECGRCTQNCPANQAGKKLDPKMIITKLRDRALALMKEGKDDLELWDENDAIYEANELDACTTCGACMEECPVHIEHVKLIMELKRYKVLTLGEIFPDAANTVNNIKVNSNPWGIGGSERFNWAKGLNIPVADPSKEVDYLYYIGCAGSFDTDGQKVTKAFCELLKKADVNFAVLGDAEKCCGDTVRRFGDEYSFYELALENIEIFKQYKFKKIVVTCPHGLHTLGKEYHKLDESFNFEVIHHTELLSELINLGKLTPNNPINEEVTYHDPCYLGRHHDGYDAVRHVLTSIPGIKIKEMTRSKDTALCCGMGGGNMWYEVPDGEDPCMNRIKDIAEIDASGGLKTSCFYCWTNFNSKKGDHPKTENMDIEDVVLTLSKSVF